LVKAGVKEVVLAVSYQSDVLAAYLQEQAKEVQFSLFSKFFNFFSSLESRCISPRKMNLLELVSFFAFFSSF
jgi:NDP-sugar pyrophosphorylase family protein